MISDKLQYELTRTPGSAPATDVHFMRYCDQCGATPGRETVAIPLTAWPVRSNHNLGSPGERKAYRDIIATIRALDPGSFGNPALTGWKRILNRLRGADALLDDYLDFCATCAKTIPGGSDATITDPTIGTQNPNNTPTPQQGSTALAEAGRAAGAALEAAVVHLTPHIVAMVDALTQWAADRKGPWKR
jgi:hypothetical protein